jgi:hypothetical protein
VSAVLLSTILLTPCRDAEGPDNGRILAEPTLARMQELGHMSGMSSPQTRPLGGRLRGPEPYRTKGDEPRGSTETRRDAGLPALRVLVPGAGVEPARDARPRRILSPMRLPVPPPRRITERPVQGPASCGTSDRPGDRVCGPAGGGDRIRTGDRGFAVLCLSHLATPPHRSSRGRAPRRPCPFSRGAGNGARTRDIHLGKVALYH